LLRLLLLLLLLLLSVLVLLSVRWVHLLKPRELLLVLVKIRLLLLL
jgi:hypothetical protein